MIGMLEIDGSPSRISDRDYQGFGLNSLTPLKIFLLVFSEHPELASSVSRDLGFSLDALSSLPNVLSQVDDSYMLRL